MGAAREASGVPLLLVTPGGLPEAEQKTYRDLGIDLFTDTDILLEGIGALLAPGPDEEAASLIKAFADSGFATVTAKPGDPSTATAKRGDSSTVAAKPGSPSTVMAGLVPAIHDFASAVATVPALPGRPLTEPESLRLLAGFGVKTVETVECASATDAVAAANRLGYPIVLKGVAEGVTHKSDFGLVHVALRDADAVARAYEATGCARVIVQPMIHGDLEAIAGISRSEGVGLVLIAGLGGIFAEALRDTVTLPIPSSQPAVERALARSSLGRILAGPRWKHPDSAAALTSLLMSLQDAALALGDRVQAIDVNPVILGADGAVAVDALVVPTA
jgi:hypothetical protein